MDALPIDAIHSLSFVLGLVCGSFVTVLSYRMPRGEGFVRGYSRCPICETDLKALDLIPLLSWITFLGRCRYCKDPISVRYPFIEITCGILFLLTSLSYMPDQPARTLLQCSLCVMLLSLSVIELEGYSLPNSLIIITLGLALGLNWINCSPFFAAAILSAGTFCLGIVLHIIWKFFLKESFHEWGVVKLAAAIFFCVPLDSMAMFLGVFGLATIMLAVQFVWCLSRQVIPIGPALAAGVFAALL